LSIFSEGHVASGTTIVVASNDAARWFFKNRCTMPFHIPVPSCLRSFIAKLAVLALLAAASAQAAIPPSQRQYLMDFYFATNGPNWLNNSGWGGVPGTECNWAGITCDVGETTVTELAFDSNNMSSTPPGTPLPDWAALPDLTSIAISNGSLTGSVPSIAGLSQLEFFSVGDNQFSGPLPDPSGLQHLRRYIAALNAFTGPLPPLTNLPSLEWFLVRNNQLTGAIPSLAGVPALQIFSVHQNQLTGGIPALPVGLQRLVVSQNQLTGPVPAAPNSLLTGQSILCPNPLTPSVSNDWNVATGETPWHAQCNGAPPGAVAPVPTLSEWALALLSLAAAMLGLRAMRRNEA
jgi:hypothetical protein